jgi:Na+-transporting NADH:ubiquinone oxidoreductase subunit NqrE
MVHAMSMDRCLVRGQVMVVRVVMGMCMPVRVTMRVGTCMSMGMQVSMAMRVPVRMRCLTSGVAPEKQHTAHPGNDQARKYPKPWVKALRDHIA